MGFISDQLIKWHKISGRHNLPWQNTKDPYFVWLSEVMLQQTQVNTVLPYFKKFTKKFSSIDLLASATEEEVLELWSGLGYYARARNLHKTAIIITENFNGIFPSSCEELLALPGIGRSTAGAISAIAFKKRKPILDGNVKRVFTRYFGIREWAGKISVEKNLWSLATKNLPETTTHIHTYTQALMDLGATICKRSQPLCNHCPLQEHCISFNKNWTKEIPISRPKKFLPTNEIFILAIDSNDHFLLNKRLTEGVWPGLWSMPEVRNFKSSSSWLKKNLTTENFRVIKEGIYKTSFTHYKLNIQYQHIIVHSSKLNKVKNYKWINKNNIKNTALPSPIRKIFSTL